jgi:hypothetical protein
MEIKEQKDNTKIMEALKIWNLAANILDLEINS